MNWEKLKEGILRDMTAQELIDECDNPLFD